MAFLDEHYLLTSKEAEDIFSHIKSLPIVDPHCHVEAEQIARNQGWNDIWEVEGATDHYVWELMRECGVPEEKITGSAPNKEKWLALGEIMPRLAGNPVYDWLHLDLQRRFGISEVVGPGTALECWSRTKEALALPKMRPHELLQEMRVEILCTTDSPVSDLRWHEELKQSVASPQVLPTWRPDEFMIIGAPTWIDSVQQLAKRTNENIENLGGFLAGLEKTHRYFRDHGAVASDHGIEEPYEGCVREQRAEHIYEKAISGRTLDRKEEQDFQTFLLHFFARLDAEANWVMQLHIGAVRNYRESLFGSLGKDCGGDVASHGLKVTKGLKSFLNTFEGKLKIVLYALHPTYIYSIATLARIFPNVFVGSPWWFADNPFYIKQHLLQVASVNILSNHAGMVSDSRKLFSSFETRMELFRRVLADVLGEMVNQGRIPLDVGKDIGSQVAYYRPRELFFGSEGRK
jgi:glucuronate isomerase